MSEPTIDLSAVLGVDIACGRLDQWHIGRAVHPARSQIADAFASAFLAALPSHVNCKCALPEPDDP